MKRTQNKFVIIVSSLLGSASISLGALSVMTGITKLDPNPTNTNPNSILVNVTAGGVTYNGANLANGTTSNTTTALTNVDDGLVLSSINAGAGGAGNALIPVTTILFNGANFTSLNNPLAPIDFFIFEAGATNGDTITVAPVYTTGLVGTSTITISTWGSVAGQFINGPTQGGQLIQGVGFSITDLKDNGGLPLDISTSLRGIAITSGGGVDLAGIYAVVPEPSGLLLGTLGLAGLLRRRRSS